MVPATPPTLGAQATSRTQSAWPCRPHSFRHSFMSESRHTHTRLSQPPLTKRFTGAAPPPNAAAGGLHDTAHTPAACARNLVDASALTSARKVTTLMWPSELADASTSPKSCGAQLTEFTDRSCTCRNTSLHTFCAVSRHTITLRSYEHDASAL